MAANIFEKYKNTKIKVTHKYDPSTQTFLGQEIHFYSNILCLTHKIQNFSPN